MERLDSSCKASALLGAFAKTGTITTTPSTHPGKHRWNAGEGEKRTIAVKYKPSDTILRYLEDMREAPTEALA